MNSGTITYDDVRDFIISETGNEDELISYTHLEKKFGKDNAYSFLERGIIYEPIQGKAKLL